MNFMFEWQEQYLTSEILFLPLEHKIHIISPPCNVLYIFLRVVLYFDEPVGCHNTNNELK